MAQPVWVLSVDLQTKTATFTTGLADAATKARGAFTDIKSGVNEMSHGINGGMFASRHAIMAVSEAFGDTMPRAITALLVHIGPLGAALEAAFPFAAIGLAAVLLVEHLAKVKEAGFKLTEDQTNFGTAAQNAFNKLDEKMIQAEIRADELKNDHMGALRHELELIDRSSMDELVHTFEELAKAADTVFADLKGHWYSLGIGSDGAKHALDAFQTQYKSLMAQGKEQEASDLLKGTRDSAQKILDAQNAAKSSLANQSGKAGTDVDDQIKYAKATAELKAAGVRWTDKEMQSQRVLVDALNDQLTAEQKIQDLKKLQGQNAKGAVDKEAGQRASEAARSAAEHAIKMGELQVQAEKDSAAAQQTIHEASIAERLASDTKLEDESYAIQLRGNAQLIAALDRGGKDYANQLKALQEKAEELTQQHQNALAALQNRASVEQYKKVLTDLEQSEREKINATEQGSAERLAAIDAALKAEEAKGLQLTSFYRELQNQRIEVARQGAQEEAKVQAELGREAAANTEANGQIALAAQQEQQALQDSARRMTDARRIAEEEAAADAEYALKATALQAELSALDQHAKDYEVKMRTNLDKQEQLQREHENRVTQIRDQAEKDRNQKILAAEDQFSNMLATSLTQVLMGQKGFASAMASLGDEVASGLIQQALRHIEANLLTKESDAAKAARMGFLAGMELPAPMNMIAAPLFAAGAFASVMAFAGGTDGVPGVGRGDIVPAMLTPGEGVVPGGVMDGLSRMARAGDLGGGGKHFHAHVNHSSTVQAFDSAGVDRVLNDHGGKIAKHAVNLLRKMNN